MNIELHGICPLCNAHFELAQIEADHITPWRDGGRTVPANCQMLCKDCNRRKLAPATLYPISPPVRRETP